MRRARKSSGRWKSGWPSSKSESNRSTRAPASSPAAGAARAGWHESFRSWRAPSGRGRRRGQTLAGHQRPISNVAAAGVAAAAEVAQSPEGAIVRASLPSPNPCRARRDLSAGRLDGVGTRSPDPPVALPHPGPPPQGGREMRRAGRRRETPAIPTGGGGGGAGVEDEARVRTVLHRVADPRIADRHLAERTEPPNPPE